MSIIPISLYDCYDYIIGLSRTECTCWDPKGDHTLDFNTSYSGLYIDELQPLPSLASLEKCEQDVWEAMNRSRENAIKSFVSDASRELLKWNELRVQPYTGVIGRRRNTQDRAITQTHAGVHIICKKIVGGYITLKKIYTAFNFTGTVAVTIADNLGNTWGPYNLNTTADSWVENDITDLELPLWDDLVDNLEYFIYYTLGANQPRNNEVCDDCKSRKLIFCANRPYYLLGHTDPYRWAESVMVGGFTTSDISRFDDITFDYGGNNFMNGLNLEIDIDCDFGMTLCMDALNFTSDPLAIATAEAILFKSAEMLVDHILASTSMSYAKLVNRESLMKEQALWVEKYRERIMYIGKNTDIGNTGCLKCKDRLKIKKGTILL
jgi:hypothetical protein